MFTRADINILLKFEECDTMIVKRLYRDDGNNRLIARNNVEMYI